MRILKKRAGQFIPISAMVMFTLVVFMVAVVNVYKVSRAKLKAQNLADAVALNLAAEQAQAYNAVTDRDEYLNYMETGHPSPTAQSPGSPQSFGGDPCAGFNAHSTTLPGISCVENHGVTGNLISKSNADLNKLYSRFMFQDIHGVVGYATVVKTVNDAQKILVKSYNDFIGAGNGSAGVGGNTSGGGSMKELLYQDIPELQTDPTIHLAVYNSDTNKSAADAAVAQWMSPGQQPSGSSGADIQPHMDPLQFEIKDLDVRYYSTSALYGKMGISSQISLGGALASSSGQPGQTPDGVGYMMPADAVAADDLLHPGVNHYTPVGTAGTPSTLTIIGANSTPKKRIGVGVAVVEDVNLPVIGRTSVVANSKAYMVNGSGNTGEIDPQDQYQTPRFQPTYWVKLGE